MPDLLPPPLHGAPLEEVPEARPCQASRARGDGRRCCQAACSAGVPEAGRGAGRGRSGGACEGKQPTYIFGRMPLVTLDMIDAAEHRRF